MSTSETITRTDLTNILNEVLPTNGLYKELDQTVTITLINAGSAWTDPSWGYAEIVAPSGVPVDAWAELIHTNGWGFLVRMADTTPPKYRFMAINSTSGTREITLRWHWHISAVDGENADYVIAEGTSGIWRYRQWNNGVYECFGTYTASIAVTTASSGYGGYRSDQLSIPAFPITFAATPTVVAAVGSGSQGCWVNNVQPTTTGGSFYLSSGASNAATSRSIQFHVKGRWK